VTRKTSGEFLDAVGWDRTGTARIAAKISRLNVFISRV
jgi:hypothetical protein